MSLVKIRHRKFNVREPTKLVHFSDHETLIRLGNSLESDEMTIVFGIGRVLRIEKGQEFDVVYMDFGRGYGREIFVKSNHARRQIYTMKRGQYSWFYGTLRYYKDEKDKKFKAALYAKAFQGWYVPKSFDIKKLDPNDIEELTKENESKINFIDNLLEGNDDEL